MGRHAGNVAEELEVVAMRFASEALDKQDATLSELRARTGTVLAASSIVASFLGATAISRDGLSVWSIAALVALGATLVLCVTVLLPREDVSFSVDGPEVYEELYEWRDDLPEVHRRLAYALKRQHAHNQKAVEGLFDRFRLACATLGAELLLWALALAVT
jgi:Mn-containing catalase